MANRQGHTNQKDLSHGASSSAGVAASDQDKAKLRIENIHLRLPSGDANLLRQLADSRNQTLSGAVRYLLRPFRSSGGRS